MTQLEIVNLALAVMGVDPLNSLSDPNRIVKYINVVYPAAKKYCLTLHPWNFALKKVTLPRLSETDNNWQYVYQEPSDCLCVWQVRDVEGEQIEYEERDWKIYTNAFSVYLTYISDVSEEKFPLYFVEVLKFKLATDLSIPVLRDSKFHAFYYQLFKQSLEEAKRKDSAIWKGKLPFRSEWLAGIE